MSGTAGQLAPPSSFLGEPPGVPQEGHKCRQPHALGKKEMAPGGEGPGLGPSRCGVSLCGLEMSGGSRTWKAQEERAGES